MNVNLKSKIIRCRPLLGTYVEITVEHSDQNQAQTSIHAAFNAIERVHRWMSFHDPDSEVSKLNRSALDQGVLVSSQTYQVLKFAKELHELSDGIFDISIGSDLVGQHLLPSHKFLLGFQEYNGRTCDIQLFPNGKVRFLKPLCIDLGGIAKGFAVDQAVAVLQEQGIESGMVNAGGDMRCFGAEDFPVHVRHPKDPGLMLSLPALNNSALATSANSYDEQEWEGPICPHVHGKTRAPLRQPFSVSVNAPTCMIADALTKVILAGDQGSFMVLSRFNARAFMAYPDNKVICIEGRQA
jgi:thiamine biosynthesis lipoprotein